MIMKGERFYDDRKVSSDCIYGIFKTVDIPNAKWLVTDRNE